MHECKTCTGACRKVFPHARPPRGEALLIVHVRCLTLGERKNKSDGFSVEGLCSLGDVSEKAMSEQPEGGIFLLLLLQE